MYVLRYFTSTAYNCRKFRFPSVCHDKRHWKGVGVQRLPECSLILLCFQSWVIEIILKLECYYFSNYAEKSSAVE